MMAGEGELGDSESIAVAPVSMDMGAVAIDWLQHDARPRMALLTDGHIRWASTSALHLIVKSGAFLPDSGRLTFVDIHAGAVFAEYLAALDETTSATSIAYNANSDTILFRGRRSNAAAVCLLEMRVDSPAFVPVLSDFADVLGLTRGEASIARAMFEGRSVGDIAVARQVSVATVRTQVRQVYAKLGTANREQFFRRMQLFRID